MFVFFGDSEKAIKEVQLSTPCTVCKKSELVGTYFQKFFNMLWIPTFPTGRYAFVSCGNCESILDPGKLPVVATELKLTQPAIRLWTFTGLVALIIFISTAIYLEYKEGVDDDERTGLYLKNPHKGDVYVVKINFEHAFPGYYLLWLNTVGRSNEGKIVSYRFNVNKKTFISISDVKEYLAQDPQAMLSDYSAKTEKYTTDEFKAIYQLRLVIRPGDTEGASGDKDLLGKPAGGVGW